MAEISYDEAKRQAQWIVDEVTLDAMEDLVCGLSKTQRQSLEDRLGRQIEDEEEDMILDLIESADILTEVFFA